MATFITVPTIPIVEEGTKPTKTYALDLETGRIKGFIDGIEACHQFIRKAIITPRFKCLIYDNQYGSEIKQTITADDASENYIKARLPHLIKDAIINDDRIKNVDTAAFNFSMEGDRLYVECKVETIYGDISVREAINIV